MVESAKAFDIVSILVRPCPLLSIALIYYLISRLHVGYIGTHAEIQIVICILCLFMEWIIWDGYKIKTTVYHHCLLVLSTLWN